MHRLGLWLPGKAQSGRCQLKVTIPPPAIIEPRPTLTVVLKQHSGDTTKSVNVALDNAINVTVSDDHGQEVKCEFTRQNNVCFLKEVKSVSATKVTYRIVIC